MNLNSSRVRIDQAESYTSSRYATETVVSENIVIDGGFIQEKPLTIQEMFVRRINKALGFCITVAISVTFISYYTAMNCEAKLNKLDNEIVRLNAENQDLQTELDRFQSFNNVDDKVEEFNLLKKADKVLEITALNTDKKTVSPTNKPVNNNFDWAIGY